MKENISDPIVWIDCEMTGLDLNLDELCEVAVVVTDFNLTPLDEGIDIIIKPSDAALDNMGDFVKKMHTDSGLLTDLENGISAEQAQIKVLDYVKTHVPEPKIAPLAGNSICTDKAFLSAQMPELIEYLHYRMIDVSSIKILAKNWYPRAYYNAPKKHGGHRALADIFESIQELRYYREVLFPGDQGPSSKDCLKAATDLVKSHPIPKVSKESGV